MVGITVTLHEQVESGQDPLNHPTYTTIETLVDNVLVAPIGDTEILEIYNLTGRRAEYQLGIPKGDTHEWKSGGKVSFFGKDWRIIGAPTEGIDALIPLSWNKKVRVERYEQG